tara:strand:+ start:935 stop:1507 length:573 start_codon:yes stop_codon:yes gene_type:complete
MADTVRTESDLLTALFQDGQSANSITAQDMRDLIVSMRPGFGEAAMQANATATTISVAGTYYKVAGTTALDGGEYLFDDDSSTSNRLRYTGAPEKLVFCTAACSFTSASNNQQISFKAYLYDDSGASGTVIDDSLVTQFVQSTSDTMSVTLAFHAAMATNDYIEIHVTNETGTNAVTVVDMSFHALAFMK